MKPWHGKAITLLIKPSLKPSCSKERKRYQASPKRLKTTFSKFLTSVCFLRVFNRSLHCDMWLRCCKEWVRDQRSRQFQVNSDNLLLLCFLQSCAPSTLYAEMLHLMHQSSVSLPVSHILILVKNSQRKYSCRMHERVSSKCLENARKSFGTDEDLLLVI